MVNSVIHGQCREICGVNHSFIPIVLEAVNLNDTELVLAIANAESYLETAIGLRTNDDIQNAKTAISAIPFNFAAVKDYLNSRIWLSNQIRMDAPQFFTDGLNVTRLIPGNLNCKVKVHNEKGSEIYSTIIVGIYHNGVLEKVRLSNPIATTATSTNILTLETPINIADVNGRTVKVFVMNNIDTMKPFTISTLMDGSNIK